MPDQVDWRAMEREASPGRAVGRLLRDQREARGLSIVDIEKRLRLRKNYVEAIEDGRFDLLPGAAYIPAFLRAYASYVGLDPEKVLTAYHLSGPVPIKRPIALPADFPIVEKRAPIGLAVLTVMLVVGAGYAVWHYLPHPQSVVAEKVPPVPDRLLAAAPTNEPEKTTTATTAPAVTTNAAPAPTSVPVTPAPTSTASSVPPVAAPAANREAPTTTPAVAQSTQQPAPPIVVTVPAPPPPVVMSAPSIGQAQAAQPATDVQEARTAQPEAAPATTPANPPAVLTPAPSLPTKIDTPLTLSSNSWVELRAPNGDILAMTYVRAGETYTVPAGIAYRIIDAR
ncbi:MAG TPA: helix-turn-helix domain-containing protein [Reyranella sp.]|nr:helix-turn-helix domain-containing protein [Reyranella sp.]